jgi:radical SAM superfamily enzyme YgiQ (UPF0313 family)
MDVILWDTRKLDVSKDFAGGFGVGQYPAGGDLRDRLIRWFYTRDRRPVALLWAHLAAIFRRLGHQVQYVQDRQPPPADLYVFCPSLITLDLERRTIAELVAARPGARVLVAGTTASVLPEAFAGLGATVVRGEAERLLWELDAVLAERSGQFAVGLVEDLDRLPPPDWSPFGPRRFRIGYDFWRFPTALLQASRGCPFRCNYCPYLVLSQSTRVRSAEAVVDEIRHGMRRWGFRSFKFRDPCFGTNRRQVQRLAELIGRLRPKIQFSVESRIELLPPEVLKLLQGVGLTSITVGIETPDDAVVASRGRKPVDRDLQQEFIATCRGLGLRTVAGFLIGFPEDTEESVRRVRDYAARLGPTFANFNVVTPYPGTPMFETVRDRLGWTDFSRFTVYLPVAPCAHLTAERIEWHVRKCFRRFYFRWEYFCRNARLLWPGLGRFAFGPFLK